MSVLLALNDFALPVPSQVPVILTLWPTCAERSSELVTGTSFVPFFPVNAPEEPPTQPVRVELFGFADMLESVLAFLVLVLEVVSCANMPKDRTNTNTASITFFIQSSP